MNHVHSGTGLSNNNSSLLKIDEAKDEDQQSVIKPTVNMWRKDSAILMNVSQDEAANAIFTNSHKNQQVLMDTAIDMANRLDALQ